MCVCKLGAGVDDQSVPGMRMMGNGVRMGIASIQVMVPSGGAEEEVWEPPL